MRRRRRQRETTLPARAVISAVGQLNRPSLPDIPGTRRVRGRVVSLRRSWDHSVDYRGKRVAVDRRRRERFPDRADDRARRRRAHRVPAHRAVDVPEPELPREGRPRRAMGAAPPAVLRPLVSLLVVLAGLRRWSRGRTRRSGLAAPGPRGQRDERPHTRDLHRVDQRTGRRRSRAARQGDPRLSRHRQAHAAGQRQLARARSSARTSSSCAKASTTSTRTGSSTASGARYDVDIIVFATGFQANRFLWPMRIVGRDGTLLSEQWGDEPVGVSRHHRAELPQPVLHVRPGHEPRPRRQPDLPLRMPDPLHHRLHQGARRRRPHRSMEPRLDVHDDVLRAHATRARRPGVVAAVDQALVVQERARAASTC